MNWEEAAKYMAYTLMALLLYDGGKFLFKKGIEYMKSKEEEKKQQTELIAVLKEIRKYLSEKNGDFYSNTS